jgi:hypothetical protein
MGDQRLVPYPGRPGAVVGQICRPDLPRRWPIDFALWPGSNRTRPCTMGAQLNRLRKFVEQGPFGEGRGQSAYAFTASILPTPSPGMTWHPVADFSAAEELLQDHRPEYLGRRWLGDHVVLPPNEHRRERCTGSALAPRRSTNACRRKNAARKTAEKCDPGRTAGTDTAKTASDRNGFSDGQVDGIG